MFCGADAGAGGAYGLGKRNRVEVVGFDDLHVDGSDEEDVALNNEVLAKAAVLRLRKAKRDRKVLALATPLCLSRLLLSPSCLF